MRTSFWTGFLFSSLVVVFAGCGSNQYEAQIQELDSLRTQVVAAHKEFKTVDSVKLKTINKAVFEDLRFIQRNYKPDSVEMNRAMLINAYKDVRKACARYFMVRSRLTKNFPYTEKQLTDLLYDLKEQTIKKEEADKYIETEKQACKSMLQAWTLYQSGVPWVLHRYDSLRPVIDSFKQTLQTGTMVQNDVK